MTLYEAWTKGIKWIIFQDRLCKLSLSQARGKFWLAENGGWRRKDCHFCGLIPMNAECLSVQNNKVQEFRRNRSNPI